MRMQPWKNGAAAQAREVNPLARIADMSLHGANRCFVHTGRVDPQVNTSCLPDRGGKALSWAYAAVAWMVAVALVCAAPARADDARLDWPLRPRPAVLRVFDAPSPNWHRGHRGVDLAGVPGQPVYAAGAGHGGVRRGAGRQAGGLGGPPGRAADELRAGRCRRCGRGSWWPRARRWASWPPDIPAARPRPACTGVRCGARPPTPTTSIRSGCWPPHRFGSNRCTAD